MNILIGILILYFASVGLAFAISDMCKGIKKLAKWARKQCSKTEDLPGKIPLHYSCRCAFVPTVEPFELMDLDGTPTRLGGIYMYNEYMNSEHRNGFMTFKEMEDMLDFVSGGRKASEDGPYRHELDHSDSPFIDRGRFGFAQNSDSDPWLRPTIDSMYIKPIKGDDIIGFAGEDLEPGSLIEMRADGLFYMKQKGAEMPTVNGSQAHKLNTKAIRERVLEKAVVVFDGAFIDVAIPEIRDTWYLLLTSGDEFRKEMLEKGRKRFNWTIKPGEQAEFSHDGKEWVKGTYLGLTAGSMYSSAFMFKKETNLSWNVIYMPIEVGYSYIRPVPQESEELRRAKAEVKAAKEHLERAERNLAEAQN